jgi:hypothetical protein
MLRSTLHHSRGWACAIRRQELHTRPSRSGVGSRVQPGETKPGLSRDRFGKQCSKMRARISSGILFIGERAALRSEIMSETSTRVCAVRSRARNSRSLSSSMLLLSSSMSLLRACCTCMRLIMSWTWTSVGTRFVWSNSLMPGYM